MSTTTAADLLNRADRLTGQLRSSQVPITRGQWESFDVTVHRLLHELLGPDAAHIRIDDPARAALTCAARTYPTPLRPPADRQLTAAQTARLLGRDTTWVRHQIRHGNLHALTQGAEVFIDSTTLDTRPDITPADPTDPHPLARLSCTLGTIADLVSQARTADHLVPAGDGEAAAAVVHVLALASVAARHTLMHGRAAEADRPLAVARYTERLIDAMHDTTQRPAGLDRLASIAPWRTSPLLNDRLETALHDWSAAARAELDRLVPSTDVLRAFANQGTHLYAVTLQVLTTPPDPQTADRAPSGSTEPLIAGARALRTADQAWERLTTATRPTHEFVTASRALFETLQDTTTAITKSAEATDVDPGRALADLTRGAETLAHLMTSSQTLPDRLIKSELLFAPVKMLTPSLERLHARNKGRIRPATLEDLPDLPTHWQHAVQATQHTAYALRPGIAVALGHQGHLTVINQDRFLQRFGPDFRR